jgi:hypothetical protein
MAKVYRVTVERLGVTEIARELNTRALVAFLTTIRLGDKIRMERVQ